MSIPPIYRISNLDHTIPQIDLKRKWPFRSPYIISEVIKDLITNKTICDIGCGEGDQLKLFSRYAKQVIGIEKDPERGKHAISAGFDVIIGSYLDVEIPNCDIFYAWTIPKIDMNIAEHLVKRNKPCKVIFFSRAGKDKHTWKIAEKYGGQIREADFHEPDSTHPSFEKDGLLWISIIEIK
jgi:hypothetical protein